MASTWIVNIVFGFIGFIIVFISSYTNNSFMTSILRGGFSFITFFLIAYLFRWMIHFIMNEPNGNTTESSISGINQFIEMNQEKEANKKLEQSISSLSEEEAELAARYIKELLSKRE